MTIKKRIFLSNILMLVIPASLSIIIVLIMFLGFTGVIKIKNNTFDFDNDKYWEETERANKTFTAWPNNMDLNVIKGDIDNFNRRNNGRNIYLSIYENNKLIYPSSSEVDDQNKLFIPMTLDGANTHTGVLDHYAFYSRKMNNYTALVTCSKYMDISSNYLKYRNTILGFGVLLSFIVIIIISTTNFFLTKYILKSILTPLEILNYGVHQIQLGNLDYRIEYDRQDEFSIVCTDFNLMAQRLRASVELRKKDETSRKELIAGISHDLRTPLTSIKAYVEGLMDGIANTPQIKRSYLETIRAKAEDINQIVDKLFMFSKLDMGELPIYPERLDIGEELASFVKTNTEEYKNKGLILKLTQNIEKSIINIDPVQFQNVLINILENSVKYKNKEWGLMEIKCFEREGELWISLSDNGPGVSKEALGKLFNIFYRGDPSRMNPSKGSGLGLAISAKIIERFHGHIWAENIQEGGLRIIITLPKRNREML